MFYASLKLPPLRSVVLLLSLFARASWCQSSDVTYDDLAQLNATCDGLSSCRGGGRTTEDLRFVNCQCEPRCALVGTCCVDSAHRQPHPGGRFKCLGPFGLSSDHVYMVEGCRQDAGDDGFDLEQCLGDAEALDDPLLLVPVTSSSTLISYRNYFCFACNEDADSVSAVIWDLQLTSTSTNLTGRQSLPHLHYAEALRSWTIRDTGDPVSLTTRIPDEISPHLAYCREDVIDSCADTWTDLAVKDKCESYMALVSADTPYSVAPPFGKMNLASGLRNPHMGVGYRNSHLKRRYRHRRQVKGYQKPYQETGNQNPHQGTGYQKPHHEGRYQNAQQESRFRSVQDRMRFQDPIKGYWNSNVGTRFQNWQMGTGNRNVQQDAQDYQNPKFENPQLGTEYQNQEKGTGNEQDKTRYFYPQEETGYLNLNEQTGYQTPQVGTEYDINQEKGTGNEQDKTGYFYTQEETGYPNLHEQTGYQTPQVGTEYHNPPLGFRIPSSFRKRYMNPHCAICNHVDPSRLQCREYAFGGFGVPAPGLPLFVGLFSLEDKVRSCPKNQMCDKFANRCRAVRCGKGMKMERGVCR